jgi:hypothetical protein
MLRQAQHEQRCLTRFPNPSVRPEPVEGQSKSFSATSRSHSTEMSRQRFFVPLLVFASCFPVHAVSSPSQIVIAHAGMNARTVALWTAEEQKFLAKYGHRGASRRI